MSAMNRVTIFSKPDCHLCDMAKEIIDHVRRTRSFELEVRNILDDTADFERYKHEIPVICVNGQEIARHGLTAARLEEALSPPPRNV